MQTADIINEYHRCTIIRDKRLIERDYGSLSGLNVEQNKDRLEAGEGEGIETLEYVAERMTSFFTETILESPPAVPAVVVVSHGIAIRELLVALGLVAPGHRIEHNHVYELHVEREQVGDTSLEKIASMAIHPVESFPDTDAECLHSTL